MDSMEKQLQDDARRIEAQVSPELRKRIDASLASADRSDRKKAFVPRSRQRSWAGALAGLAAAAAFVAVLTRTGVDDEPLSPTPEYTAEARPVPLTLHTVELTDPLQQELQRLQADAEKVRATLERELGVTF